MCALEDNLNGRQLWKTNTNFVGPEMPGRRWEAQRKVDHWDALKRGF